MGSVEKIARATCSVALAAGLCWPCGLALADEDGSSAAAQAAAAGEAGESSAASQDAAGGDASSSGGAAAGEGAGDPAPDAGGSQDAADEQVGDRASDGTGELPSAPSGAADATDGDAVGDASGDASSAADDEAARAASQEADRIADEARASLADAEAALSDLDGARASFAPAASGAPEAVEAARVAREEADRLLAASLSAREEAATARVGAMLASAPHLPGTAPAALDKARLGSEKKASDYGRARVDAAAASLGASLDAARASERTRELLDLAEAGNDAAFEAELAFADCRKALRAAQEAADSIPDSVGGAAEFKANVAADVASIEARRAACQARVAEWYELVESAVGAQGALSFGAGVDFGLSEGEFVAKWGAAIDSFLEGRGAPLAGYGRDMARAAYKWRIDPRLCAAVSITESSGGMYCIRPHNAWGWGAADSDPYNLAWEWGSWEEAIEAWHEGVATNTAGLATARTLTAFGEIYASSPDWAANTAASMRQITPR